MIIALTNIDTMANVIKHLNSFIIILYQISVSLRFESRTRAKF